MKKISNIIVPTDFSITSRNAYHYALGLAEELGAEITLVHVKDYFMPVTEVNIVSLFEKEEESVNRAFEAFIAEETPDGNFQTATIVKSKMLRGNPLSQLEELSETASTDLMVIGTRGLQDFISRIFGSTSISLAKNAHCPVILVPREASWSPIDQVMYASSYASMTSPMLSYAINFAQRIQARMHFVHVEDDRNSAADENLDLNWKQLFVESRVNLPYRSDSVYGQDVSTELNKYAVEHAIKLMVLVTSQHNFWENLTQKSVVQSMALSTKIPLMVMHPDDASL